MIIITKIKNFCYYPDSLEWTQSHSEPDVWVPDQRRGHTAVLYNTSMVVFGGFLELFGSSDMLWVFDLGKIMYYFLLHNILLPTMDVKIR